MNKYQAVAAALRAAADELFPIDSADREYLMDGEPTTFSELYDANSEDEDFLDFLIQLEVGEEMNYGMPSGWGAASFHIERVK